MILAALALALTPPADVSAVQLSVQINGTPQKDYSHTWAPLSEKGWVGDCKDFALEKRKELIALGYDPSRVVVWLAREKGFHAVLVVDNRWVLDTWHEAVEPLGRQHAELVCAAHDLSADERSDDRERCR